jgi:hypothetical protein
MRDKTEYLKEMRRQLSREHNDYGVKDLQLKELLADEHGHIQGCYHIKPADTEV